MKNNLLRDDSRGSNGERSSKSDSPKHKVVAAGPIASSEWRGYTAPLPESEPLYQSSVQLRSQREVIAQCVAEPSKLIGSLTLQEQDEWEQQEVIICAPSYEKPCWNLSRVRVLPLPVYHRMEKFNTTFPKENLPSVLLKLQNNFCADSLTVQYQDGSATETALARCLSMDGVKFVVQVWQSSETEYVVEIQRTGGDVMLFSQYRYAKRILNVIERCAALPATDQVPPPVVTAPADPLLVSQEAAQKEQSRIDALFKLHNVPAPTDQDALSSVEIAGENLASVCFDRVSLGLHILMSMTDSNKVGFTMAVKTSNTVLLGEDNAPEMTKKIPNTIASLAFSGRLLSAVEQTNAEFAPFHAFSALTVVAQAVNNLDKDSTKLFVEQATKQGLKPIEVLLKGIANAGTETHVAYLSAHILAAVCRAMPSIREAIRTQFRHVVQHANGVGVCTHAALAQASQRLLQELSVNS